MSTMDLIKLDDVERALLHGEAVEVVEAGEVSDDIVRRILAAESLEEAAQDFTATPADDIDGIMVEVVGIAWMRSEYKEGSPVYALMQVIPSGDTRKQVVSIGGRSVLAMLLWAQRNEAMPFSGVFRKRPSKSTEGHAYWTFSLAHTAQGKGK